ncbi:hypothetical protein [Candidatus Amarobacter glycogenicus]
MRRGIASSGRNASAAWTRSSKFRDPKNITFVVTGGGTGKFAF